jgi:hypothetical protein
MEDIYKICHRMIYLYNITKDEKRSLNPYDYPINASMLKKTIDHIINDIKFTNLPENFQKVWMDDKFDYVTWGRDKLLEYQIKTLLPKS